MRPLTRQAIDEILGCTPCVCGDMTTWHQSCYRDKTQEQIDAAYARVYRAARKSINNAAGDKARDILAKMGEPQP